MKNITDINSNNIEKEIEIFEQNVDFEVIPVIAQQSSYTDHVSLLFTWNFMFWVAFVFYIFYEFLPEQLNLIIFNLWNNLTGESDQFNFEILKVLAVFAIIGIILFILITYLCRFNFIKRLYISKDKMRQQVSEKAKFIFFEKRLNELKTNNAILIFVSVLERRIVILPDPRINLKDLPELSQKALQVLQKHFKQSEYELGLIEVIQMLKNELKEHYPRPKSEKIADNQYSNKLIWWND